MVGYSSDLNKFKCASKFPNDFHSKIEKATLEFTNSIILSFHQDIKRFRLQRVKDYTPEEVRVAKRYYNSSEKYKSINEFNRWRDESVPLIEYKNDKNDFDEIVDVEII